MNRSYTSDIPSRDTKYAVCTSLYDPKNPSVNSFANPLSSLVLPFGRVCLLDVKICYLKIFYLKGINQQHSTTCQHLLSTRACLFNVFLTTHLYAIFWILLHVGCIVEDFHMRFFPRVRRGKSRLILVNKNKSHLSIGADPMHGTHGLWTIRPC